jgi:glycosyltransferase involved in cell wall biosynthesis
MPGRRLKLLYASVEDANDPSVWSGIPYRVQSHLRETGIDLCLASPLRRSPLDKVIGAGQKVRNAAWGKTQYLRMREPILLRHFAAQIETIAQKEQPDAILATSTLPIARLETDLPLFLWGGSTFRQMHNYYPEFSGLSKRSIRTAEEMESEAVAKCDAIFLASDWARRAAIRDYGARPADTHVVPWGGVAPETDVQSSEVALRRNGPCRLLVIGNPWRRKGIDAAIEATMLLREEGFPCELTIVGDTPPAGLELGEGVKLIRRLDRRDHDQRTQLENLLTETSFLLALSSAEAYGQVVNEAGASWLPVIASRTGGLADAVVEGVNGVLVECPVQPRQVADVVRSVWTDELKYNAIAQASSQLFQSERSWPASVSLLATLIQTAVGDRRSRP